MAVIAAAVALGSFAQVQAGPMEKMDTNKDNVITKDEFKGKEGRFLKLDTNGDGKLTQDELRAGHRNKNERQEKKRERVQDPDAFFTKMDKNSDGMIDTTEFENKHFAAFDRDKNGSLSKDEVKAMPRFLTPEQRKETGENTMV